MTILYFTTEMPWGVIFAWPVVSAEIYRLFSWLHLSDWANHYVSCDRSDKPRQYFPEQSYLHGALRDHYSKSGHWTRLLACCPTFSFLDAPQKNKLHFQWKVHSAQTVKNRKMATKKSHNLSDYGGLSDQMFVWWIISVLLRADFVSFSR